MLTCLISFFLVKLKLLKRIELFKEKINFSILVKLLIYLIARL